LVIPTHPEKLYGRVLNVLAQPIDHKEVLTFDEYKPVHKVISQSDLIIQQDTEIKYEIIHTGIKTIDLLFPLIKGSRIGLLEGRHWVKHY